MAAKFDVDGLHCQFCFHIPDSAQSGYLHGWGSGIPLDSKDTSQNAMQRHEIALSAAMPD
jgi:hypothetical protein